jgi:hypothetical protein
MSDDLVRLASVSSTPSSSGETSIKIFSRYIHEVTDAEGKVHLDASAVTSRQCFEDWKENRKSAGDYEKGFQRSLTAHLTKSDGRRPFTAEEEAAVLLVVRQKKVWPAFEGTSITVGVHGFRATGFHEQIEAASQPPKSNAAQVPSSHTLSAEPKLELEVKRAHFDERHLSLRLNRTSSEVWAEILAQEETIPKQDFESLHKIVPRCPTPEPLLSPTRTEGSESKFPSEMFDF